MNRRARSLALLLLAAAAALLLAFRGTYEPDLFWHLAQGRYDAGGHLVRSNIFSFTYGGYRQNYTGWAGDLGIYAAWRIAGYAGVQAAEALTLAATFVLAWLGCRRRGSAGTVLAVLLVGFLVVEPRALPRPHVVSFAGMAACALVIERCRAARSARPLLAASAVIAVWSNFHVEAIFGAAVVGAFAVGEYVRPTVLSRQEATRALGFAAVGAVATLVNPYGFGIVRYLAENALVPQTLNIAELQPPYLPNYRAFFAYVAVGGLLLLWQFRTLVFWELLVCGGIGVLALQHLRFTTLFFMATAPLITARVQRLVDGGVDQRALVATAAAAALTLSRLPIASYVKGLGVGEDALVPPAFFSQRAVAYARTAGLHGPVFNSHNLGGYLAWTLYPDATIFQDGRLQAYPPEHFRAILDARTQQQWNALVVGVDWAMLSPPRPNELSGVGRFPAADWATVYRDPAAEILVRRAGAFGRLAGAPR